MELFELKANIREAVGKGAARVLRRDERIPAILYGPQTEPVKMAVKSKDLETAFKQSVVPQVLVNLTVLSEGGKEEKVCPAIIKDLQVSPLSRELLHADFLEIDLGKKVKVNVPVEPVGKAKGVEFGGLLQVIRRELEILCMPLEIPSSIQVDITDLDVGDSVHVQEIEIEGVEIPADVNFTVITVTAPKGVAEEEEEGEEEEGATETAEGAENSE